MNRIMKKKGHIDHGHICDTGMIGTDRQTLQTMTVT